jgi:hypothetical protein
MRLQAAEAYIRNSHSLVSNITFLSSTIASNSYERFYLLRLETAKSLWRIITHMADGATSRPSSMPKGKTGVADTGSPRNLKQKEPDTEETVMSSAVDDAENHAEADGEAVQMEIAEGISDEEEAVLLGSVDGEGNVVDKEGSILGKVDGEVPEGSMVDSEGDVLDAEGNVIGSARGAVEDATKKKASVSLPFGHVQ